MTRTDPPDILVSTVYRDINVNSAYSHSLHHPKPCDSQIFEDEQEKHNNLNSAELWCEQKKITTPSMEYAYRRAYRPVAQPDVAWNPVGQQDYHRFSSPDLFNTKLAHQQAGVDVAAEVHRSDVGRNSRSRSAPRVMTTLTPVHFEDSPPTVRRGRDVHRVLREPARRLDPSPHREASNIANRTMLNEVHPIKLQPQMGDGKRCSPLYIADGLEENRTNKPATSPHVKCRVDIKPDEAVLRHTARKQSPLRAEVPWQWSRSLSTPRWIVASRTPTPSDSCSVEYRQPYQYASSLPNNYIQPDEMPLHRMPSPMESRAYFGRERRAHSSPNVPARFLYTEDPVRYPPSPAAYYRDHYSIPNPNYSPKVHFVDSRTHTVPMAPSRSYYAELEPYQHPHQAAYPKAYSANEELPYAPTQTCYSDDPKTYHIQTLPPKVFYTGEPLVCRPEHYLSSRAYHTEDRRRPHVSQSYADDWYGSDVSSYTAQPTPLLSQYTLPRARQEATLASSYPNPCMEPSRLGVDARAFSKSWDNILNPHAERQQPVQRGRSYENLLSRDMSTPCPNARRQPVVINLSSSPRRYAALSLSDNSLTDRSPTDGSKNRSWFVTPEITITDNDIQAGNLGKMEAPSASWDALDSGRVPTPHVSYNESTSFSLQSPKEKSQNSSSLQQSLEQLDELLADLYIDYKTPSSRRSSEALLDQLKKLINDEDAANADISAEDSKGSEEGGLLEKQPDVAHASTNNIGKHCGSNERLQKSECSPDQSTDDDETMICSNSRCQRTETVFNACLYYKSCHSCYTYYCSRNCRREDWDVHKENCLYGRISSVCRRVIKFCRETEEVHKAFSRIAKVGYLSRGRGILFLGFPNPGSSSNFLQYGLESLLMSPTYLSLRELDGFKENLGEYCKELQEAGRTYDPSECFLLNVSVALGEHVPGKPSPRGQIPTVRKHAKITLASTSPEKKVIRKESEMETLILTPPPGMADMDKEGEEGRKAREICFINIQRELRTRGVFLRHEYPDIYQQLCEFVESNKRFTPTTIYPIDKRTGKQFMCMIMAGSEPRTLDWLGTPNLLDDII